MLYFMLSCVLNIITPSYSKYFNWRYCGVRQIRTIFTVRWLHFKKILLNISKVNTTFLKNIIFSNGRAVLSLQRYGTVPNGTSTRTPKQNKITIYRSTLYSSETVPVLRNFSIYFWNIRTRVVRESYGTENE